MSDSGEIEVPPSPGPRLMGFDGSPVVPPVSQVELDWIVEAQLYTYDKLRARWSATRGLTADQSEQLWDTATALVEVAYRARRAG